MTKEVIKISKDLTIFEAAKKISEKSVSSLVVVENDKPIAIISEKDIVKGILSKKTKVKDVMDKDFIIISPNNSFSQTTKYLREKKIKRFPVVENNRLIGLVTETDIVEATRDFTRFHEIQQDIILAIFGLATAFFLFYFSPLRTVIFG